MFTSTVFGFRERLTSAGGSNASSAPRARLPDPSCGTGAATSEKQSGNARKSVGGRTILSSELFYRARQYWNTLPIEQGSFCGQLLKPGEFRARRLFIFSQPFDSDAIP